MKTAWYRSNYKPHHFYTFNEGDEVAFDNKGFVIPLDDKEKLGNVVCAKNVCGELTIELTTRRKKK